MGPMTEDTALSAAEKAGEYLPSFVIIACINLPDPAASASAEPDMLAKTTLCRTLTCANPPGKRPTTALQKRSRRSRMLPELMMAAARMNNGIASKRKLEYVPLSNCSAAAPMSMPLRYRYRTDPPIMACPTGTPSRLSPTMV